MSQNFCEEKGGVTTTTFGITSCKKLVTNALDNLCSICVQSDISASYLIV